jgi:hypothetical protein
LRRWHDDGSIEATPQRNAQSIFGKVNLADISAFERLSQRLDPAD